MNIRTLHDFFSMKHVLLLLFLLLMVPNVLALPSAECYLLHSRFGDFELCISSVTVIDSHHASLEGSVMSTLPISIKVTGLSVSSRNGTLLVTVTPQGSSLMLYPNVRTLTSALVVTTENGTSWGVYGDVVSVTVYLFGWLGPVTWSDTWT